MAAQETSDIQLMGLVRRVGGTVSLAPALAQVPVVEHFRDLGPIDSALVCVPLDLVAAVSHDLLQARVPIVECGRFEGHKRAEYYERLAEVARHHRTTALVGAGWNPGMVELFGQAFQVLVPHGHTSLSDRPGASLHHTAAAERIRGVKAALATEVRDAQGRMQRYVYVELAPGIQVDDVQAALAADPAFIEEQTLAFAVDSVAALEEEGHGMVLERRGTAPSGAHQTMLLEGRFDTHTFAARVMIDGARRIVSLKPGLHRYALWLDPPYSES
jgi:diaminopimelate dehydrogenase